MATIAEHVRHDDQARKMVAEAIEAGKRWYYVNDNDEVIFITRSDIGNVARKYMVDRSERAFMDVVDYLVRLENRAMDDINQTEV